MPPADLVVIGNTGDDAELWGLHISPDLDSVCYTLAGVIEERRGWGLRDETFQALDQIGRFGEPTWFNLGDRDLATHLHRTRLLRTGAGLAAVTADICRGLGVDATVLPMSEDAVRTRVLGPDGWLSFQEYFVREKAQVAVRAVEYVGAAAAAPGPGVLDALARADAIVICPSNPITSIRPILAVPGIVPALEAARARITAVSPIVGGAAVSGPAGRLMAAMGLPVSATGVARAYAPWLDTLVLDERDRAEADAVRAHGAEPVLADTLMTDRERERALAARVLATLT
jgi:LPPG:FO 2-phospho-L-lactate transferase